MKKHDAADHFLIICFIIFIVITVISASPDAMVISIAIILSGLSRQEKS